MDVVPNCLEERVKLRGGDIFAKSSERDIILVFASIDDDVIRIGHQIVFEDAAVMEVKGRDGPFDKVFENL